MRRRGIVRGSFGKLGLLGLALVLGLGSLTVGYAAWTDTVYIEQTVTTGEWVKCETAYAYGDGYATSFNEIIGPGPWGWTNGPLEPGEYEFDIYAGAGGGEPEDGTLVGTLTVEYDGSTVTVTYNLDSDYTMDTTHLYVGTDSLPTNKKGKPTVAPGQYGNTHDDLDGATTDSYTIDGFSGEPIYVVAHAVVCWFEPSPL